MRRTVFCASLLLTVAGLAAAQRLPHQAIPSHYDLALAPNFTQDNYTATETIGVRVLKPTSSITLNAIDLQIQRASITSGGATQNAKVTPDPRREMVTLAVARPLAAGPAAIRMQFAGVLNNQLRGFYLAREAGHKYAVTQFEPTDARRAFPCFDEPALKATFSVTLIIPQGDMAIANGRVISDTPGPGVDRHTVRFSTSPKMSTYLVAFLVGDFECLKGGADGIPIRVCAPPREVQLGQFALTSAEHILPFYDRYFGIKYPYGKLDLIAVPDFEAGAMENAAAITFRDTDLLLDNRYASDSQREDVASVIAHEMAHQWFGDLVTMQWWNDIWLNEGFATWMSSKPVETWKPGWEVQNDDAEAAIGALHLDSLASTRSIQAPHAETSAQINQLFDGITYDKTAAVLRMLEAYVGPEAFRRAAHTYLTRYEYSNASAQDFWNVVTQVTGKPVNEIMPTFVLQPGVPMISVHSQCDGGATNVTLSQQRYYFNRALFDEGSSELWQIPVCIKTASGAAQCELLKQRRQSFRLRGCAPWVFADAGAHGYYWLAYPPNELQRVNAAAERGLTPLERVGLLADETAMAYVGKISIGDYLSSTQNFVTHMDPAVIGQVTQALTRLNREIVTSSDRNEYRVWVRQLLRPTAQRLGWKPAPGEGVETKQMRADVLGALGDIGRDPEVLAQATQLAKAYMKDRSSVDPTMVTTVLHLAALDGNSSLYDEFLEQSKQAKSPDQHYHYLYALADFTQPALIDRSLDYAMTPAVREQDFFEFMLSMMANPASRMTTWKFVKSHWMEMKPKLSTFGGQVMVEATSYFCSATDRDDMLAFFKTHPVPDASASLKQATEAINLCLGLKAQQAANLAAWLGRQAGSQGGIAAASR